MKNLKEWCMENEEYEILELYNNAQNKFKSDEIGFSASKVVNWKCEKCGMSWEQSLNKMTIKTNGGCSFCNHQKPSYFYNLITEFPELEKEWDYEQNLNKPIDYLPKSKQKVWWKCVNGHVWEGVIRDRSKSIERNKQKGKPICPFCNHEKVSTSYNLVTEFPNIAKQWDYNKNGSMQPLEISPKTNKKVWWICEYNPKHVWADRISNRTVLNRGCPICSKEFTISFPARTLYYYLKPYFGDCEMEFKVGGKYILDIFIPYYKIAIEYDGWYYHSNESSKRRESRKDNFLKSKGIDIIRIKDIKENIEGITYKNNIIEYHLQESYKNLNKLIEKVISVIENKLNIVINKDINFKRDYQKIDDLYYHTRKSNSLAVKNPELVKQWSSNNILLPDTISPSSNYKAKWICQKCNREYEATIHNRIKNNSGCPYCSNKKVSKENSLANCFPSIAKEWNYEKNGELLPEKVTYGSDKKVWWKCKEGHEWKTRIYLRTGNNKLKCPYCSHRRLTKENSLEVKNPELNNIWNYEKNNGKTPKDFSYSSNKKVWWKCKKGHEWLMSINRLQRIKNEDKCPKCRNIKMSENNLNIVNKELSEQ